MRPMRVLFLAPRFHSNQADLIKALRSRGHEVEFGAVFRGASECRHTASPWTIPILPAWEQFTRRMGWQSDLGRYALTAIPSPGKFVRQLREIRPDVIVVRELLPPYTWLAGAVAPFLGARVTLYSQDAVNRQKALRWSIKRTVVARLLGWSWYSPVASGPMHKRVLQTQTPRFIPFIKRACDRAHSRAYTAGPMRVLAVGKLVPRKNHEAFIDSLAMLRHAGHSFTATIIGEVSRPSHRDYAAHLEHSIRRQGLNEIVTLHINVPYESMCDWYLSHDVYVQASFNEPASVSHVEAMAHGMPVVCNRDNGTAYFVDDGITGWLCDGNAADIAMKLEKLLLSPQLTRQMGSAALERLQGEFSADFWCSQLEGLMTGRSAEKRDRV
jgi:glycosyltransferase involved in cell wall biosynthesis